MNKYVVVMHYEDYYDILDKILIIEAEDGLAASIKAKEYSLGSEVSLVIQVSDLEQIKYSYKELEKEVKGE